MNLNSNWNVPKALNKTVIARQCSNCGRSNLSILRSPRPAMAGLAMTVNFLPLALLISALIVLANKQAFAATAQEVLSKYEQVIVKSNQMNVAGYNLQPLTFKLKRMTEVLLANQLEQANRLLDDIQKDLKVIEAKGPEYLRRERRLAWLEVYGDLIQQLAIFIVIALILLRFAFVKNSMQIQIPGWKLQGKLIAAFSFISIFSAFLGVIRYGPSSWSFVDAQVIWVGIASLIGGLAVGLTFGIANGLARLFVVPQFGTYFIIPIAIGFAGGLFHKLRRNRPLNRLEVWLGGLLIGFAHTLLMYGPIQSYMLWHSFVFAVLSLSLVESGIVLLFFILAQQIFKEEKRKETERELFRARLQFLQAQINPHFLFNTLNTIAAVSSEEGTGRARNLIIQLSTFFRRLTKREGDFVTLQDELEYIDAYLNIEKARFGERLTIEKEIQLSETGLRAQVPILVLQPIVENAVKHGLSKKSEGGTITIRAEEKDSSIAMEIQDTGIGMNEEIQRNLFKKEAPEPLTIENHAGIGLRNINERMTKLFGRQFQIQVTSAPGKGTTVQISFPKKL